MKEIKIHILYNFHKGPWGGGNQFLKALREEFLKKRIYEENPKKADCILFNSHQNLEKVLRLKLKYQNKIFIHRVDGPIFKVRNKDFQIDRLIFNFNNQLADGTVFQSTWSREENIRLGLKKNIYETIIMNAPNPVIFNNENKLKFEKFKKIRLIASSWSANWIKGFKIYQYLDENLDYSKYDLTFIGNSPIKFKNIKWIKPIKSHNLAKYLKQHNIYIAASLNDPCSNSLIEALHCGLPAVVRYSGGHPEIIRKGGEIFISKKDVTKSIEKVVKNYSLYQKNINLPHLDEVAQKYIRFMKRIYQDYKKKVYTPKKIKVFKLIKILLIYIIEKMRERSFNSIKNLLLP